MAEEVALSEGIRGNVQTLQRIDQQSQRISQQLATGRRISGERPVADATARSLDNRAADLARTKDSINEGLNTIKAGNQGLSSAEKTLNQMKAIADQYNKTPASDSDTRTMLENQYNELAGQIQPLLEDAGYSGNNVVAKSGDSMEVRTNAEGDTRTIAKQPTDKADTSSLAVSSPATIDTSRIDDAVSQVRQSSQNGVFVQAGLQIRQEFNESMRQTLEKGAARMVQVDIQEQAAKMVATQTRQQLSTESLSIASQSQQSILRMF